MKVLILLAAVTCCIPLACSVPSRRETTVEESGSVPFHFEELDEKEEKYIDGIIDDNFENPKNDLALNSHDELHDPQTDNGLYMWRVCGTSCELQKESCGKRIPCGKVEPLVSMICPGTCAQHPFKVPTTASPTIPPKKQGCSPVHMLAGGCSNYAKLLIGGTHVMVTSLDECVQQCLKTAGCVDVMMGKGVVEGKCLLISNEFPGCRPVYTRWWKTRYDVYSILQCKLAQLSDGFADGDGLGGREFYIDNYPNRMQCLEACYQMKLDKQSSINGATYGKLGTSRQTECYCETGMKSRKPGATVWESSFFVYSTGVQK